MYAPESVGPILYTGTVSPLARMNTLKIAIILIVAYASVRAIALPDPEVMAREIMKHAREAAEIVIKESRPCTAPPLTHAVLLSDLFEVEDKQSARYIKRNRQCVEATSEMLGNATKSVRIDFDEVKDKMTLPVRLVVKDGLRMLRTLDSELSRLIDEDAPDIACQEWLTAVDDVVLLLSHFMYAGYISERYEQVKRDVAAKRNQINEIALEKLVSMSKNPSQ